MMRMATRGRWYATRQVAEDLSVITVKAREKPAMLSYLAFAWAPPTRHEQAAPEQKATPIQLCRFFESCETLLPRNMFSKKQRGRKDDGRDRRCIHCIEDNHLNHPLIPEIHPEILELWPCEDEQGRDVSRSDSQTRSL